jgi:hypothetical protein
MSIRALPAEITISVSVGYAKSWRIIRLAVSVMIFVFSPAHAFTLFIESGIDRPGCDFKNFVVPNANPGNNNPSSVCMDACGLDKDCAGWSFDPRSSTCFLKNNFCEPVISGSGGDGGIKLPATMSGQESDVDRPGCDFSSFPATNPTTHGVDPQICHVTCAETSSCQAWNFDAINSTGYVLLKKLCPSTKSLRAPWH